MPTFRVHYRLKARLTVDDYLDVEAESGEEAVANAEARLKEEFNPCPDAGVLEIVELDLYGLDTPEDLETL